VQLNVKQAYCGYCQKLIPPFKLVTSAGYVTPLKQLISSLKYHNNQLVAHELAQHLARRVTQLIADNLLQAPQYLVAVPLHRKRLQQRGYNQAQLITESLSQLLDIPTLHCVHRIVNTTTQTELDAKQRETNLKGAFSLITQIPSGTIALVDDVYTTGATMQELARTLNVDQHLKIQMWSIARTTLD